MLILAAFDIRDGAMTVGDFVVVNTYLMQLAIPLNMLGTVYREIRQALVDMENLALIDEQRTWQIHRRQHRYALRTALLLFITWCLVMRQTGQYSKTSVFLSPPAPRQQSWARPGSGKSTLCRLLLRFYDPQSGRIEISGQDIRRVTQHSLRSAIGVVPQDTVLFNDTLFYNIAYGDPGASPKKVHSAADSAQLYDFIAKLPQGY